MTKLVERHYIVPQQHELYYRLEEQGVKFAGYNHVIVRMWDDDTQTTHFFDFYADQVDGGWMWTIKAFGERSTRPNLITRGPKRKNDPFVHLASKISDLLDE